MLFYLPVKEHVQLTAMHAASSEASTKPKKVNVNMAHLCLGHISLQSIQKLARKYGWTLTGTYNQCCDACAYAKGKQKNVKNTTTKRASRPCERLFIC